MSPYNGNRGNQGNGQRRPPSENVPHDRYEAQRRTQAELNQYRPSVREVRPTRSHSYSYNSRGYSGRPIGQRRHHRRPTPFLIIIVIFLIALLAVILTSKSFKRFVDSITPDETEAADTAVSTEAPKTDTEPPVTETEPPESDTMPPPEDHEFLICIDPGHGFGDGGSSHENLGDVLERDINLAVAKRVYDYLFDAGYSVIMSHNGEEFPKSPDDDGDALYYIDERVSFANSQHVDLFVSIHCDTFPDNDSVSGTRIYYCSEYKYSTEAEKLSDMIKASINDTFPKYKEARTFPKDIGSAFYVTAYTDAPSALIELGFISNPDDAANLINEEWQGEMAYAISNAVSAYINQNADSNE